jgi:hypothetical protein
MVWYTDEQIKQKLNTLTETFGGPLAAGFSMLPAEERDDAFLIASTEWEDLERWLTVPTPAGVGRPADSVLRSLVLFCPAREGEDPVAQIHTVALVRSKCHRRLDQLGVAGGLPECHTGMLQVVLVGQGYSNVMALSHEIVPA